MKYQPDFTFLEESTETLRAIAHPLRLSIITLLHRNEKLSVTEIFRALDIQQAVASHHLRILRNRKVVKVKRIGQNSIYSLASPHFYKIIEVMGKVIS